MMLEKSKNKKYLLLYLIGVFILSSGVSFAFFTGSINFGGTTNPTVGTTDRPTLGTVSAETKVDMDNANLFPGHKEIVTLKVTGTGEDIVLYNLIYNGINTFKTDINYKVYKSDSEIKLNTSCEKKIRVQSGVQILREECNITNIDELGNSITSGTINKTSTESKQILLQDQVMETIPNGKEVYYYIEIEYPNLESNQNNDLNSNITGIITVEDSNIKYMRPTLTLTASTVSGENNWYKSVDIIGSITGTGSNFTGTYCIGNTVCIPTTNLTINNKTFNISIPNEAYPQVVCASITDQYGISTSGCTDSYNVDNETPTGSISVLSSTSGTNNWYKELTLKIDGSDAYSKVASIKYCITTSEACTPSTTVTSTSANVILESNENQQKVCYQVIDTAGNSSATTCSDNYSVDKEKPTVSITSNTSTTNTITINVSGSDSHSKIDKYYYKIENGSYEESPSTSKIFSGLNIENSYMVYVYAVDKAGNKSEVTSKNLSTGIKVENILTKYTKDNSRSGEITAPFTGSTPTTVYSKEDDYGTSYVFAGVNPNNWVKLENMYFRIIRFNGNGSMRLIYSGTGSPATSGTGTQIGTSEFNPNYNNNKYVGLQYTTNQVHGIGTNSTILGATTSTDTGKLYGWYNSNLKNMYEPFIDSNVGFCSDRDNYTDNNGTTAGGGTGTTKTYYGAYIRYKKGGTDLTTFTPTLKCKNSADLLKLPVGLITVDEYMLAGGGSYANYNKSYFNTTFWLHTGQKYWTMTPNSASGSMARVYIASSGYPYYGDVYLSSGVRPVINLKSNTIFESNGADGTSSKPWTVKAP